MNTVLDIDHITLTFADGQSRITALDDASMRLSHGEIAAITGPSGSGKSTLLAVASTLLRPDTGQIYLSTSDGRTDIAALSPRQAAALRRNEIGFVFQQPNLVSSLTVLEQLEVTAHLGQSLAVPRGRRRQTHHRAMHLLDAVGMVDQREKKPGQLSGGQQQRVNIARALMNKPGLLVIDEPTSALDQQRGAAIIDLIVDVVRYEHAAALLVTHDRTHLTKMDTMYHMVDGTLTDATMQAPQIVKEGDAALKVCSHISSSVGPYIAIVDCLRPEL